MANTRAGARNDFVIEKGATFQHTLRINEQFKTISSLTSSSTSATAVVDNHCYDDGDRVYIKGANECAYNGNFDITYIDNDTFSYTLASTTDTPATGTIKVGKVLDLTNYDAEMDVRVSPYADSERFTLTTSNGRITIDGTNGIVSMSIAATDTEGFDAIPGTYDLKLTSPADVVDFPIYGNITVFQTNTRD